MKIKNRTVMTFERANEKYMVIMGGQIVWYMRDYAGNLKRISVSSLPRDVYRAYIRSVKA